MRAAFISDIHGNAIALDAVLEDISKKKIDKIFVLGDICYRGPEPKRSLQLVQSLKTDVIKGNADEWTVRGVRKGEVPDHVLDVMNEEREWIANKLDEADFNYLRDLPTELHLQINGVSVHAFHATPESLFEIVPPHADDDTIETKLVKEQNTELYIYAHIHKPYIRHVGGKVIINIGSVGLPFDGVQKAAYCIVDVSETGYSTSIERVSFDIEKVIQQYEQADYPNKEMMANVLRNAKI